MDRATVPDDLSLDRARRARTLRRLFIAALCVFLALGAVGALGVRSTTVKTTGGGYELEVRYAQVARPGLAAPWSVMVRRPGGFTGPVTIASDDRYFDIFDENSLDPDPDSATSDGERIIWEFSPPEQGDTMTISLDTRIGPNVQWGREGTTSVVEGGRPVATVTYRTIVLP